MRILHRYVFMEMLKALALAVAAVSGLVCFAMVLKALQEHGLGPVTSILYMGLSLPGAIYISLPLAGVLAATLVYGRLASDSEIQACRASGIPESSLLWPAVLMAILTSGLVFALGAWPVPESKYAAKRLALADVEQLFFSQLSNGKISIKDANFEMTADRVVGNMVYGPTIKHRSPTGQTYCYAPYGEIAFVNETNEVTFALTGAAVMDEGHPIQLRGEHRCAIALPRAVPRSEDDLNLWWLMAVQHRPELSDRVASLREKNSPEASIQAVKESVRATATGEFHSRLATALGCFGLVLVGATLGIFFSSGHLLTAFGVALPPGLGATILTMAFNRTVARFAEGADRLAWLIWAPNVAVVVLALLLIAWLIWVWASPIRLGERFVGRRA